MMRRFALGCAVLLAAGCGGQAADTTTTVVQSVTTTSVPVITTAVPATSATAASSTTTISALAAGGAALGAPGSYGVGQTDLATRDAAREDRRVWVQVFYPAETDSSTPQVDAAPDTSGAPYPVVLGDASIGADLGPHLASHGFVFLAVRGQSSWGATLSTDMIDYPLDQIVALNTLEALDGHLLTGLADTSRAGAIGYSFGSWDALMLAGARIDPEHYLSTCAARPEGWSDNWWQYICGDLQLWECIAARAEEVGIATPEGLWAPMGDQRIKAVMPMGPEGFDLIGPEGLAGVTVPALFVAAQNDQGNDYFPATTSLFEYYPNAELITFMGADHLMIFEPDAVGQMGRFAVAFFGYHLAGREDFAPYLTKEFVEQVAPGLGATDSYPLVWGLAES
jgi:predicted dienelactone hydrolase